MPTKSSAFQSNRVKSHEASYLLQLERARRTKNLGCLSAIRMALHAAGHIRQLNELSRVSDACIKAHRDLAADPAVLAAVSAARSIPAIRAKTFDLISDFIFLIKRAAWQLEKYLGEWTRLGDITNYRLLYLTLTRPPADSLENHFEALARIRVIVNRRLGKHAIWRGWFLDVHESSFPHLVFLMVVPSEKERALNRALDKVREACFPAEAVSIHSRYVDRAPEGKGRRNGAILDIKTRRIQWCLALAYATKVFGFYRPIPPHIADQWDDGVKFAVSRFQDKSFRQAFLPRVFGNLLKKQVQRRTDRISPRPTRRKPPSQKTASAAPSTGVRAKPLKTIGAKKITQKFDANSSSQAPKDTKLRIKRKNGKEKSSSPRGAPEKLIGKRDLKRALKKAGKIVTEAAKELGISERTMRKNMNRVGLIGRPRGLPRRQS